MKLISEIPDEWVQKWKTAKPDPEMNLPPPNPFLTTDFALLPEEIDIPEYPQKILDTALVELWYKKDQKFKLPTANYHFYLISPLAVESAVRYDFPIVKKGEKLIGCILLQCVQNGDVFEFVPSTNRRGSLSGASCRTSVLCHYQR